MDLLHSVTREVIFTAEAETVRELVEAAISAGVSLRGADLVGADLRGISLKGKDLREVDFCRAILHGADLRETDLRRADLEGANLCMAQLEGANLQGTALYGSNLHWTHAAIGGHNVIQINGLKYPVIITDTHMQVWDKTLTFQEWRDLYQRDAQRLWREGASEFYTILLGLMDALCKDREAAAQGVTE